MTQQHPRTTTPHIDAQGPSPRQAGLSPDVETEADVLLRHSPGSNLHQLACQTDAAATAKGRFALTSSGLGRRECQDSLSRRYFNDTILKPFPACPLSFPMARVRLCNRESPSMAPGDFFPLRRDRNVSVPVQSVMIRDQPAYCLSTWPRAFGCFKGKCSPFPGSSARAERRCKRRRRACLSSPVRIYARTRWSPLCCCDSR